MLSKSLDQETHALSKRPHFAATLVGLAARRRFGAALACRPGHAFDYAAIALFKFDPSRESRAHAQECGVTCVDAGHQGIDKHLSRLYPSATANKGVDRFVSTDPQLQYPRLGELMPAVLHTARVNRLLAAGDFDVVHDHTTDGPMTAPVRRTPTVVTVHGPVDGEFGDYFEALGDTVRLVAISKAQRELRPRLAWAGTVHNALPDAALDGPPDTSETGPDRPVLWLARFTADKGPDLAIEACRAAGLPLVLAGKCNEKIERRYLAEVIEPRLHDGVRLAAGRIPDHPSVIGDAIHTLS